MLSDVLKLPPWAMGPWPRRRVQVHPGETIDAVVKRLFDQAPAVAYFNGCGFALRARADGSELPAYLADAKAFLAHNRCSFIADLEDDPFVAWSR
jgi:hypothetical protein